MSRSCVRVTSPRSGGSTLMTSAPIHASSCVHAGPAWTWVMSTTRMPSRALLMTPGLLVHRLVHGPGREGVGIDPDVDQRRLARLAGPLERRPELPGRGPLFAVAAEHLRELVVGDVAELVADVPPLGAVLLDLAVADLV